jgi:hypothetical protein
MKGRSIFLGCLAAIIDFAQVNTGSLIGNITDASRAVVSGATIEIRNLDTDSVESLLSNSEGIYRFPFLRPGRYSVRVQANGFRVSETNQIEILIGKETTFNVNLEVGLVSESVTVDGAAPLVEATTGQASSNFDSSKVISLPRLIAGIDRLALLAPGVAPAQATTTTNGATPAVNAQRRRSNDFLIDGQDNNHPGFAGPSFPFNNVEVIAEYQIITNQSSAEYGKSQGGSSISPRRAAGFAGVDRVIATKNRALARIFACKRVTVLCISLVLAAFRRHGFLILWNSVACSATQHPTGLRRWHRDYLADLSGDG